MLKEYLLNFGFTEKDYENIISTPRSYSLRNDSLYKHRESVEANIQKAESLLLSIGYSQEDLDKIRTKSKLKVIK